MAAIDEVLLGFIFCVEGLEVVAQVDEHLIFIHPVGEAFKLFYYFVLLFVDC